MSGSSPGPAGNGGGRLTEVVAELRRTALRRGLGAAVVWVGVGASAVLLGAWLLAGPGGWEPGTRSPILLDLALFLTVVGAALFFYRWRRVRLEERSLARSVERASGLGPGAVLGVLEISRTPPPGVSRGLARRAEEGVLASLPDRDRLLEATPAGPALRWIRRGAVGLVVTVGTLGVLTVVAPDRSLAAWSGLVRPARAMAGPALPPLELEPGGGELPRGRSLTVRVRAPGRDRVTLRWQFAGDVARSREASVTGSSAAFELGELTAPVEIRAESPDGAAAGPIRITPLDPLLVTDLRVELTYPPHTGRQSERFRREVPHLEVPAGTRIRIDGRASRALSDARLADEGGGEADPDDVDFSVDGRAFLGEWRPRRSGTWSWRLRDAEGRPAADTPPPLSLAVVPDSAPSIAILEPGRDTLMSLDRRQPLLIRARDDYGIATIELRARRVETTGAEGEPVVQTLRAGGTRGALARPLLDLREWDLLPGDEVRYRAVAVDNGPAAQRAESREFSLRVPRRGEASREVEARIREAGAAVDSLRRDAESATGETRELQRRAAERRGSAREDRSRAGEPSAVERSAEDASFEGSEDVRRAAERQEELLERADSLRRALDELERSAEDAGLGEPGLREDLEELRALMQEAADPEARDAARELSERADEMRAREMEDALEALARGQEELRRELDRALERFRRAAAEQGFRAAAREARELAGEQEAVAAAMREEADSAGEERSGEAAGEGEAGPEGQEAVEERAAGLQERMEELDERLTGLGEEEARRGVEAAGAEVSSARDAMSRSAQQRSRGMSASAGESGERAAGELREAADALDRARNQMARQMDEAVKDALRRAATEALSLARRQAELRDRLRGADASEVAEMRGDEADLLQGLRNLAGNVGGVAAMAPGVGESVLDAVGGAAEALGETLQAMESPRSGGGAPAEASERAVAALNRIAMAAGSGGGQQSGGQGTSSGAQQMRQQVQALARQQGDLMDRTGALSPMPRGSEALERRLQEVAGGQETVAEELRELSRRQRGLERGEQLLGDLQGLSEQAADVAERLGRGRLDRETRQRQERLFHRLLDAGRSLEQDQESRQRESSSATEVDRDRVEALTPGDRGGARFGLPDAAILQSLTPAQRALVVRYFERLNRETGGPGDESGGGSP